MIERFSTCYWRQFCPFSNVLLGCGRQGLRAVQLRTSNDCLRGYFRILSLRIFVVCRDVGGSETTSRESKRSQLVDSIVVANPDCPVYLCDSLKPIVYPFSPTFTCWKFHRPVHSRLGTWRIGYTQPSKCQVIRNKFLFFFFFFFSSSVSFFFFFLNKSTGPSSKSSFWVGPLSTWRAI